MKVTVLGAGTCIPYPNFSPAGYLIQMGEKPLLLDAGPGTVARMAAQGFSYQELDFILISHLHTDHVLDLLTLLQANNATPGWQRTGELTVIGCQGIRNFLEQQYQLFEEVEPETYSLRIYEMHDEKLELGDWSVTAALTRHTDHSLAYRISHAGKSLVYSGDASSVENLVSLARGADLLLGECSFPEGDESPYHLSPAQIGALAQKAAVGRVALTHRYLPAIQADVASQVKAYYGGEVIAVSDGWSTTV